MRNDTKPIIPQRQEDSSPAAAAERPGAPGPRASGGRLRDSGMERTARMGDGTDASAFDVDSGKRSISVSLVMSALAMVGVILIVIIYANWPEGPITPQVPDEQPATQPQ